MNDLAGNQLPANVSQGQFKWAVRGMTNGKLVLIGRAEMVSRSRGISTSYSCNDPCPPYYEGSIDPFPPPIVINGSGTTAIWETAYYDTGYNYYTVGPYTTSAEWTPLYNPTVVTFDPSQGHSITVTGMEEGGTTHGFIAMQQDYGWDGLNCYEYGYYEESADAPVEVCTKPTSESTASAGWSTLDPTFHEFEQTLAPAGTNFVGRSVTEQDPGGGGPDTCWFTNSAWDKYDKITGGTWTVQSGNKWGKDSVGYKPGAVGYYRNQGRAPCGTSFQQRMVISCSTGPIAYITNNLAASISATTVSSSRAGNTQVKNYP